MTIHSDQVDFVLYHRDFLRSPPEKLDIPNVADKVPSEDNSKSGFVYEPWILENFSLELGNLQKKNCIDVLREIQEDIK